MDRDAALRRSLLALAALMVAVGIWTFSLTKILGTYAFGILGIAGILLPDWEFFDRDFSQWFSPMPARRTPGVDPAPGTWSIRPCNLCNVHQQKEKDDKQHTAAPSHLVKSKSCAVKLSVGQTNVTCGATRSIDLHWDEAPVNGLTRIETSHPAMLEQAATAANNATLCRDR
ncbi:signal peptidase complex-like protein DTM1 [Canna indica]|uniref:Signal peptidase complex-like protein DTM1 n=1 Tax=Canna indica TaxID=4628 RepID=A0AAQ3K654_9LILI|nr:signal peptidase complex-like protein DTM1 [Canna indica]